MKEIAKRQIRPIYEPCEDIRLDLVALMKFANNIVLEQVEQTSRLKARVKEFNKRCKTKHPEFNWKYYGL